VTAGKLALDLAAEQAHLADGGKALVEKDGAVNGKVVRHERLRPWITEGRTLACQLAVDPRANQPNLAFGCETLVEHDVRADLNSVGVKGYPVVVSKVRCRAV